jgi:LysR family transcriptional regulator, benzoate and cis,cis-muconate-responsive activator of ben and cat genes
MELRHLRYFIAVAEELNFSRAAERLHVSQPPLSRQIRDLETELQVQLLQRDRQSVRLTPAGRALLARSRKLVQDAESLKAEAQTIGQGREQELQIGYAPSPTAVVIAEILARHHELSPGARITLHDLSNVEMMSGLRSKKLQAALTVRPPAGEMRGLKFETIRHHPPGIICSPGSPLARQCAVRPTEVAGSKLVVYRARDYPEYHAWVSKVLGVRKNGIVISEEYSDVMSLMAAVQAGRGVAVVGDFITPLIGDRVRFVPFVSGAHFLEVGLLYRKSGLGETIERFIAAALAGRMAKDRPSKL